MVNCLRAARAPVCLSVWLECLCEKAVLGGAALRQVIVCYDDQDDHTHCVESNCTHYGNASSCFITQRLQSKPTVLDAYQRKAEAMQQAAMGSYVKQQLEYVGFWPLAKLAQVHK